MEGKHLVVLCKISFCNRTVATHALHQQKLEKCSRCSRYFRKLY